MYHIVLRCLLYDPIQEKKLADTDIKEGIDNVLAGRLREKGRYKN